MRHRTRLGLGLLTTLGLSLPVAADEDYQVEWSTTLEATFKVIEAPENDDDVTGLFDQYEFTPNKGADPPAELAIREAVLDYLAADETPLLQFRLESPTSNLGVSGSQIDRPFLNQHAELYARPEGTALDLEYRRFRTEELRLFPEPTPGSGVGSVFSDGTSAGDVFYMERTSFAGDLRFRLSELLPAGGSEGEDPLSPELSVRGGYEARDGRRQLRFCCGWQSTTLRLDQEVSDVGGGLLIVPGRLFNLVVDFDYQGFREDQPALVPPGTGFIPDTDRWTGSARLQRRFGDRAVVHGGFQMAKLEQVGTFTAAQQSAVPPLRDNDLDFYSASFAGDVRLVQDVSANAFFKFDRRDNDIDRSNDFFNPGTQVAEFLDDWSRYVAGGEVVYRPHPMNQLALGARGELIDRDLDFATGFPRIEPQNALLADETRIYSVYGRGRIRPLRGLRASGEIGWEDAPETGYITDLGERIYGKVRVSYTLPLRRPVELSVFGQGYSGENDDFEMVAADGTRTPRDFERYRWLYGLTLSGSPGDDLTLYASFHQGRDAQDYDLVGSSFPRYFGTPDFPVDAPLEYRSDYLNVILGGHAQLTEATDTGLSYGFTYSDVRFRNATSASIGPPSRIEGSIHRVSFELGHWLFPGLRVSLGYRFYLYDDDSQVPQVPIGPSSVVAPFDLSTTRHAVSAGATLTSDLLDGD